jgi:mannose-6-phosphate isomerase-like protein (cupin superfamily)
MNFDLIQQPVKPSYLAPDGSEIRSLAEVTAGGLCHCTLPAGQVAAAVSHRTVEEIWYFIEGHGEVWRKHGEEEFAVEVRRGTSLTIPVGTHFQFRNTGQEPLCLVIATMPRWPGPDEAKPVEGQWQTSSGSDTNH